MTGTYCTERTPSPDKRPHVCRRSNGHTGAHTCTCGFNWWWTDETDLQPEPHDLEDVSA